ncbi:hypothetical protein PQQ77_02520 [Paraburkholderia strydomiana]|uniref:hypothetical protein n=1 Tax=Paraburkholderia strydomiana TaxID=1245417 RepID=UPI0038BDE007
MLSIKDAWNTAAVEHDEYMLGRIDRLLSLSAKQTGYIKSPALRSFLKENRTLFGTGNVSTLRSLVAKADAVLTTLTNRQRANFMSASKKVFDYKGFCDARPPSWCAYRLCQMSAYNICPYCNQAFAFTVVGTSNSFRPTLDHFFPKSKYPYLALSLFNLVPSCYVCNSNLKGDEDFFKIKHLHPLEDDEEIHFELISSSSEYESFELLRDERLFDRYGVVVPIRGSDAANRSISTFLLRERFFGNLPAIERFIKHRRTLTPDKLNEYRQILGYTRDEATYLQFDATEYKNELLGKIFLDMYRQFAPT